MSFQKAVEKVLQALNKEPRLNAILRPSLIRVGLHPVVKQDFQGGTDEDALSLTFVVIDEDDDLGSLDFGDEGKAELSVRYNMLLRLKFERAVDDRVLDRGQKPGLLTLVRLVKNALYRDRILGDQDGGADITVGRAAYPVSDRQGPYQGRQVEAMVPVTVQEVVQVGNRPE